MIEKRLAHACVRTCVCVCVCVGAEAGEIVREVLLCKHASWILSTHVESWAQTVAHMQNPSAAESGMSGSWGLLARHPSQVAGP